MTARSITSSRHTMARFAAVTAAMLGLATVVAAPTAAAQPAGPAAAPAIAQPKSDKDLGDADRAAVAAAAQAGKSTVTLLVAAEPDRLGAAADQLRALGGVVQRTDDATDYLRVEVPTAAAENAAKLDAVFAVDVDRLIERDDPRPDSMDNPLPQPAPGPSTPRVNPYMPTQDTQAAQFVDANPTFDGRGTTIAILDSGVDLDHPALARTTTGQHKIVDWYNANAVNSGDNTWVQVTGSYNGSFTVGGVTYAAPATGGPYAFGLFRESAGDLGTGEPQGDINRDGDRTDTFGVLQDTVTKRVHVDVDQDLDFVDEPGMIDFKVNRDMRHFGADRPETPVLDRVAFVVVTDRPGWVNLGIAAALHGSHVAGITAANGMFGGAMSGAAPGANIMAVKVCLATTSCTTSGLIDGVLYAAHNGADVVNISIGGLPGLNDGNTARGEIYNRTIDEFDMQIFTSAGNSGAGANTVGDPSVITRTVSVGSYITAQTWLSNYGSDSSATSNLHPYSSRGPREDGGFKPTLVAPGSAISTTPQWQAGAPVPGTYVLPPGYAHANGTSMASPQATGAAALLVGAYKATFGVRPSAAALRSAMTTSATFQANLGAYEQGAGLFWVPGAWNELRGGQNPHAITSAVPVNTVLASQLVTPGVGVGIHDREGVEIGQAYTRTYTLTRTTGPNRAVRHEIKWLGNDGTFSTRAAVNLPLNQPVELAVRVNARTAGAHSAVLHVDDPTTRGIDLMTLNSVFAAQNFTSAASNVIQHSGRVARNDTQHYFVRVPTNASALKIDMQGGGTQPSQGQVRFLRFTPQGLPADTTSTTNCYNPDAGAGCAGGTPFSRTVVNPQPGVWEIVVEARRTSSVMEAPFTITATVLGTVITPNPDVVPSATIGVPQTRTYTVTNQLSAFNGRLVGGGTLGSTQTQRPTIAHQALQQHFVTIPAGVSQYVIRTLNPSDLRADIDMVVYRCAATCVQVGSSGSATSVEQVTLNNPAAGQYRIDISGFSVPAGATEYDLIDTWISPALGTLTSNDANAGHGSGTSWTATATLLVTGQPGAGRQITGTLAVVTDAGVTVGGGTVVVQSVTG